MADSVLDLLLRVKKAGAGDKEAAKGLNSLGQSVKKVRQEFKDMKAVGAAFNAGMTIVNAGLKAVSDSAEHLGRTELKTAFSEAAEAGQDLQDTLVTLKIGGRDSISWVTDAATGLKNLVDVVNIGSIAFLQMTGRMSDSEAAARATALVYEDVKVTTAQLEQATLDQASALDESTRANREYKTEAQLAAEASALAAQKVYDHQLALEKATGPASDLAFAMGELNAQNLFTAASAGLDEDAQLQLAVAMGIVDQSVLDAKNRLDELREQYGVTGDAAQNGEADVDGYTAAVYRLNQELDGSLERLRAIQAEFNAMPGGIGGRVGGATGDGVEERASGGPVSMNVPYMVGERGPELFVPDQSGTIIPNSQTTNMGGINITISGAGDPAAVAREVKRQLNDMGRSSDNRSRI